MLLTVLSFQQQGNKCDQCPYSGNKAEADVIYASSAQWNHLGWEHKAVTLKMFKEHAVTKSTNRGYKQRNYKELNKN